MSLGVDTLLPTGDEEHFRFAVEHADEVWDEPMSEREKELLERHLPKVRDHLFKPEEDR